MADGLRIVHLDSSPVWRGGQQQLLLLARELRRLGCEQIIVARPGVVSERMRAAGLAVLAPGIEALRAVRRAQVAHAHDGRAHAWMLAATTGARTLRVLSRRVAYPIRGWASRWKYRRLHLALAVSACVRAQMRATGLPEKRIVIVTDAVELEDLPAPCPLPRSRTLVCLGAFTPEKGVGDLLQAFARLPGNTHLLLAGEGPLRSALEREAEALGCAPRVRFAGNSGSGAADWIAAADLLVMPSRQEGLGSAALLAMALERPVVATTAGGIPELIKDGVTGLLVPPADPSALAAACLRLLDDPALAARLAAAAKIRVHARHAPEMMARATLEAYRARI